MSTVNSHWKNACILGHLSGWQHVKETSCQFLWREHGCFWKAIWTETAQRQHFLVFKKWRCFCGVTKELSTNLPEQQKDLDTHWHLPRVPFKPQLKNVVDPGLFCSKLCLWTTLVLTFRLWNDSKIGWQTLQSSFSPKLAQHTCNEWMPTTWKRHTTFNCHTNWNWHCINNSSQLLSCEQRAIWHPHHDTIRTMAMERKTATHTTCTCKLHMHTGWNYDRKSTKKNKERRRQKGKDNRSKH